MYRHIQDYSRFCIFFAFFLVLMLPAASAQCAGLELKDKLQTMQIQITKPVISQDTITASASCLPEKFMGFVKENNIGFPIICQSGCPRYSVIGYAFLQDDNTLKGSLPCGHVGQQASITFTVFDPDYNSSNYSGLVRYTGTSDSIPLIGCTGKTDLKVSATGPKETQSSRAVKITAETSENARCKWSRYNEKYSSMTAQFSTGKGTRSHSTYITAPEGASTVYISCMDMQGNAMLDAVPLKIKVEIEKTQGTCTDTDGGKDAFTRGTCTDKGSTQQWTDSCTGKGDVVESFCQDQRCELETITCKSGNCVNGACRTDADEDGVPDETDACPGTKKGADTDSNGCAKEQRQEASIGYVASELASYKQGNTATFMIRVKNTGTQEITNLWTGLDIYSAEGVRLYRTNTPNATDGTLVFNNGCRGGTLAPNAAIDCKAQAQFSALPAGRYNVKAAAWNANPGTGSSLLDESKSGFFIYTSILKPITLTGRITDDTGAQVQNAHVEATDEQGMHVADTFTGADGKYLIQLPPYPINLNYSKPGHVQEKVSINTPKSGVQDMELRLEFSQPRLSQPSPTGRVGQGEIVMQIATDRPALCSYSTEPGTPYYEMESSMLASDSGQKHTAKLSDPGVGEHTYYIKCISAMFDEAKNKYVKGAYNENDYPITFTVRPGAPAQELPKETTSGIDCNSQSGIVCTAPSECSQAYSAATDTDRCCKGFCYNAESNCLSDGRIVPAGENCTEGNPCECTTIPCLCQGEEPKQTAQPNAEVLVGIDKELMQIIEKGNAISITPILVVAANESACLSDSAALAGAGKPKTVGAYAYLELAPVPANASSTAYTFKYAEKKECEGNYRIYTKMRAIKQ